MKKLLLITLLIGAVILNGCQSAPTNSAVVGKNDNVLESAFYETQANVESTPTQISYTGTFASTDGSVEFHWDIDQTISINNMPVVEVEPSFLDSKDFQRIAEVLLGNVVFYEREPSSNPQYSKSQYQEMIELFAPYSNLESMSALVGTDSAEDTLQSLKNTIAKITAAMESAPEENPHTLCDWTLKKERVYNDGDWDIGNRTLAEDNDWLVATTAKNGMGYKYMVVVRDQQDYKLNRINLQLGGLTIDTYLERQIYWSKLCCTGMPSQQQIEDAQNKVLQLLGDMELGDWRIADTQVDILEQGEEPEYLLNIQAVPVFNGISVVFGQKNPDIATDYSGAYVLTQATFIMSANGDLISMQLDSPVNIKSVVNNNVATMSFSELVQRAQQHLSLSDADNYGYPVDHYDGEVICNVNICEMEYGLARIMVEDTTDSYYYVPALMLRGNVEYCNKETGNPFYRVANSSLLCINAIDGSIIE